MESCTHNRSIGLDVVWEWLTTWWKQIQERFRSSGAMGIGELVNDLDSILGISK